jgi:His-Xaa-Ser system protein HxsD
MSTSHTQSDVIEFVLDLRVYETDAILRAAYRFIDDYYVSFRSREDHEIEARFVHKGSQSIDCQELTGEFHNELLHCVLRRSVFRDTKEVREMILGRALFGTVVNVADTEPQARLAPERHDPKPRRPLTGYSDDSAGVARDWFSS